MVRPPDGANQPQAHPPTAIRLRWALTASALPSLTRSSAVRSPKEGMDWGMASGTQGREKGAFIRRFTVSTQDLAHIGQRQGDANRLGFAVPLFRPKEAPSASVLTWQRQPAAAPGPRHLLDLTKTREKLN